MNSTLHPSTTSTSLFSILLCLPLAMAASSSTAFSLSLLFAILLTLTKATYPPSLNITIVNNCPYHVWPAIQPNAGLPVLERGGFFLHSLTHRSFYAPTTHWSGRVWGRTHCTSSHNHFSCATGDCGHRFECNGLGGAPPATLVQFSLHHGQADFSSYGVSLVDGFNIPLTVTPHEGKGNCPVVGCRADLLANCPEKLRFHGPGGKVVGCKSGCEAFGTDELCCRNHFNSKETCKPSIYSRYFKETCPATFTYAHDTPSLMHECSSPRELKIIFCH